MNRLFRAVAVGLLAAVGVAFAADDKPNPAATPRDSRLKQDYWKKRHESFVARAAKGDVDVLFLGDSITQGWEGAGKAVWADSFKGWKAANFGIGGDRTEDVLWRITGGKELNGIDPKLAVIMIGTNNVGSNSAEQIAGGVKAILDALHKAKPKTQVLLLGVFPRSGKAVLQTDTAATVLQPKIKQINDLISKFDDGKTVHYLDFGAKFLNDKGELPKALMPDYLHLSAAGYRIWADAIAKPVEALLKK